MRHKLLFLFLLVPLWSWAQQEVFRGVVVDSASLGPLPYVSVRVKGTLQGTSTDTQGSFTLVATRKDSLIFSLVGYRSITIALWDWEPSMIRMSEQSILLKGVTIEEKQVDPYAGMFDEQNAILDARKIPFYFSKTKRQKRKLSWLREDNIRASTYVALVITNPSTKDNLMKKYKLTEEQYYSVLADFNTKNYRVMYYLTTAELLSLLNEFFEGNSLQAKNKK